MILFAALVKAYKDKAWKSYRHEDGELCFGGGWFIVGIDTPEGSYTYHYENKYWDMFDCVDLQKAKHWDGHTEADAETRLMSLNPEPNWIPVTERLPVEDVDVLCQSLGGRIFVASYGFLNPWGTEKEWITSEFIRFPKEMVKAWMPLPELYK